MRKNTIKNGNLVLKFLSRKGLKPLHKQHYLTCKRRKKRYKIKIKYPHQIKQVKYIQELFQCIIGGMIKITTKEEDNVKPGNIAIIFRKYPIICISRNNRKNILHITTESSDLYWYIRIRKIISTRHNRVLNRYKDNLSCTSSHRVHCCLRVDIRRPRTRSRLAY